MPRKYPKKFICEICGKEYWKTRSDGRCSMKCGLEWRRRNYIEKYGKPNHPASNNREKALKTCLRKYGVDCAAKSKIVKEKSKQTFLRKYGFPSSNMSDIVKQHKQETYLQKYGVKHPFASKEIQEKIKNTFLQKYGVDNFAKSKQFKNLFKDSNWVNKLVENIYQEKSKNHTFNTSRNEEYIYNLLCKKFPVVLRQYKTEKYPYACDFYIPSLDLYIEYQGTWHHGKEPFDNKNTEHIKQLKEWKQKAKTYNTRGKLKIQYLQAINKWTVSDPEKRRCAKLNNLNYLEFFTLKSFLDFYETLI